ncbi:hypothetical protein COLO4_12234 [Corchorus olitorius]|uniref:Uncharacterized protein n=1 Tax=Corchorus olitorius TaxID=93759 RepID=A0A1R3K1L4_9ROSI|nr:hypothetical protein COLO4_12234 [Corchorus olitorius]
MVSRSHGLTLSTLKVSLVTANSLSLPLSSLPLYFSLCFTSHGLTLSPLNVVNLSVWIFIDGQEDVVNYICDDEDIKAISFVGSNTVS